MHVGQLFAQLTITPDTLVCKGSSITLSASVTGALNTTHYSISSVPYQWDTLPTPVSLDAMKDDDVRGPLNIGFQFSFLCGDYTQFYVGSNGWISFGTPNDISWNIRPIPSTAVDAPKNSIMGPWEDWNPRLGGQITYGVKGIAPNRKLVVTWTNVPMYACTNLTGTFQIVIEETTNNIFNNILYKPAKPGCSSSTNINATQGLQNMAGTVAFAVPGRNGTLWQAQYESKKFTPDIDSNNIMWFYTNDLTGDAFKWYGKSITVAPDSTSNYSAFLYKCNGDVLNAHVKVSVIPGMTSQLYNKDTTVCKGQQVILAASASGGKPQNYKYIWVPDHVITNSGLHATRPDSTFLYKLIVTDECSVPDTHQVRLNVRPPLKINVFGDTTICYGRSVDIVPAASGGYDSTRVFTWGGGFTGTHKIVMPVQDTLLRLILSDNCTIKNDTANIKFFVRRPLNIVVSNDTTICIGDSVRLKATATGGDSSHYYYSWNNGLTNVNLGKLAPDSSFTHKVVLSDGCTPSNDTDEVFVRVRQAPQLIVRSDSTICKGQSIVLYANAVNGDTDGVSLLWNSFGLQNNFGVTPQGTSVYHISMKDRCLVNAKEDSVKITVRQELQVKTSGASTICYGESIHISALASGGDSTAYQFLWNTGNTGQSLSGIKPLSNTAYSVTLTDNCTSLSGTDSFTVNVLPKLLVKLPDDTLLCKGSSFLINTFFSGGAGSNYHLKWNGDSGNTSLFFPFVSDTVFILEMNDGCSLPAFDTIKITAESLPQVDYAFTELSSCTNVAIDFKSRSVFKTGSVFKWEFDDGSFETDSIVHHKFTLSGNYKVKLTVTSLIGCADSVSRSVPVIVRHGAFADFDASSYEQDITKSTIRFTSLSGDSLKHNWIFGNTGLKSDLTNPSMNFKDAGSYLITLIVQNSVGCFDTISKWIKITDDYAIYIPNSFTPNSDGLNDYFIPGGIGIKEFKMTILDRGGNVLFETNDIRNAWNGRISNGTEWPMQNVFRYSIYTLDYSNTTHFYEGFITMPK